MMGFWADHSLNAIDSSVSKRSGRNYTWRHTARGKMTLPWKCIAMDTIRNDWLITSTRNLDSFIGLPHLPWRNGGSGGGGGVRAGDRVQPRIWSVHKYSAAGSETVSLYNPIFPKSLLSDTKSFVEALTTLFVFLHPSSSTPRRRSSLHQHIFSKLVHFTLLIIRQLNLDPSNL